MTEEQIDHIIDIFSQTGSKAFEYAIRGIMIEGYANILFFVIFSVISYFVARWIASRYKDAVNADSVSDHDDYFIHYLLSALILSFTVVTALMDLWTGILQIFTPEWQAIKALLEITQ